MASENNISDEALVQLSYSDTRFRLLQTVKFAGRSRAEAIRLASIGAQQAADELLKDLTPNEQPAGVKRRRGKK